MCAGGAGGAAQAGLSSSSPDWPDLACLALARYRAAGMYRNVGAGPYEMR